VDALDAELGEVVEMIAERVLGHREMEGVTTD
jgi:hypothetical protein